MKKGVPHELRHPVSQYVCGGLCWNAARKKFSSSSEFIHAIGTSSVFHCSKVVLLFKFLNLISSCPVSALESDSSFKILSCPESHKVWSMLLSLQVGETSVVNVDCSQAGPGELSLEAALDSPPSSPTGSGLGSGNYLIQSYKSYTCSKAHLKSCIQIKAEPAIIHCLWKLGFRDLKEYLMISYFKWRKFPFRPLCFFNMPHQGVIVELI